MTDGPLELADGRMLGYADFNPDAATPVIWCHGGPGSRLEPKLAATSAVAGDLRIVGIDRPGYGLSTPRPGRSIESFVPDLLAVADHLGFDTFYAVGVSTGGAYALATASIAPDRVRGVIPTCALTDMRVAEARASMTSERGGVIDDIWNSTTRGEALAFAAQQFGEDGSKLLSIAGDAEGASDQPTLAPADIAMFSDPTYLTGLLETLPPMFAWGVQGYADDRLADGPGWVGFDVNAITCRVIVAHGTADTICPPINGETTATLVPNAELRMFESDGHFSVVRHVPDLLAELAAS